jgi:prevent-host-death family protein
MEARWQLQEAKNKLSMLVERARQSGPQIITLRGREAVVVLSVEEYRKITAPHARLTQFLRGSPLVGIDVDLARSPEPARDVPL